MKPLSPKLWFKNIWRIVKIYTSTETHFWRRGYVCHGPYTLPLTCSLSQDLTSKSCLSQALSTTGFRLSFVKGNHQWEIGGLEEWKTKDIVTLSPLWAAFLVVVISPLWSQRGVGSLAPGFHDTIPSLKRSHPIMAASPFTSLRIDTLIYICKLFLHCYKFYTLASL